MTEDDYVEVGTRIDHYLDDHDADVGERFIERLLRGSEKARPDQMVGTDPVVCMDCFIHIRKGH